MIPDMIPEDSMLRRHYLTEWRYNQDKQLLNGLCNPVIEQPETCIAEAPKSIPLGAVISAGLFVLFLLVLF